MTKRNAICAKCRKELNWVMDNVAIYRNSVNAELEFVMIGEKYKCAKCGATIITDFGEKFLSTNYDQKYLKQLKAKAGECIEII